MISHDNSSTQNVLTFVISEKEIEGLQRCCAHENLPFDGTNV